MRRIFETFYCRCIAAVAARLPLIPAIFGSQRQFKGEIAAGSGNLAAMIFFDEVQNLFRKLSEPGVAVIGVMGCDFRV